MRLNKGTTNQGHELELYQMAYCIDYELLQFTRCLPGDSLYSKGKEAQFSSKVMKSHLVSALKNKRDAQLFIQLLQEAQSECHATLTKVYEINSSTELKPDTVGTIVTGYEKLYFNLSAFLRQLNNEIRKMHKVTK